MLRTTNEDCQFMFCFSISNVVAFGRESEDCVKSFTRTLSLLESKNRNRKVKLIFNFFAYTNFKLKEMHCNYFDWIKSNRKDYRQSMSVQQLKENNRRCVKTKRSQKIYKSNKKRFSVKMKKF